jgi:hypothetical protein
MRSIEWVFGYAGGPVFLLLCYVVLRRFLQLALLHFWSNDLKELEIVVLRHELTILRRRTRRPEMTRPRRSAVRSESLFFVSRETIRGGVINTLSAN